MDFLETVDEIRPRIRESDHWDRYTVTVRASLWEVVAAMMAYRPWWMIDDFEEKNGISFPSANP